MRVQMLFERSQRSPAYFRMSQLTIARRVFELRQQIERDIRGLIVGRICPGYVGAQRSQGGLARERANGLTGCQCRRAHTSDQTGCDGFHVSLDA